MDLQSESGRDAASAIDAVKVSEGQEEAPAPINLSNLSSCDIDGTLPPFVLNFSSGCK